MGTAKVTAMTAADRFQVDLHGVVDLLAQHIYSSPRVFLRELLQNGVDAITARRALDPSAPATIDVRSDGRTLRVSDTGVGLSADQVSAVLATIGRSTKRDGIGLAREEFLGQFGVGLLSAFMVAEEIQVVTRPAEGPPRIAGRLASRRADRARCSGVSLFVNGLSSTDPPPPP